MNAKKMITFSNLLIVFGLIAAAIGGYLLNKYSAQSTENSFNSAKDERLELKNKLNEEFVKTSKDMTLHKDYLNAKIEKEATEIIKELKEKSSEANNSLENLKRQSDLASSNLFDEVSKLKESNEKEFENLAFPLPSELKLSNMEIIISAKEFDEYLTDLREKFDTNSILSSFQSQKKDYKSIRSKTEGFNPKLIKELEKNEIQLNLSVVNDNNIPSNENIELGWSFRMKILLNNDNNHFSYNIDTYSTEQEYFKLQIKNW